MTGLETTAKSATDWTKTGKNSDTAKLRFHRQANCAKKEKSNTSMGEKTYNKYPNEQARNMTPKDYQK